MQVGGLAPSLDRDLSEQPRGREPGEMAASRDERDAVVVGQIGGGANPVRPGGDEQEPTVCLVLWERLLGEDIRASPAR